MSEYDNTNRGSIWKNDRKDSDTHPDFTGSLNVEGVEYFCDAWKRKPDANPKAPALSFKVKRKDKQPTTDSQRSQRAQQPPGGGGQSADEDDFSDPIPF